MAIAAAAVPSAHVLRVGRGQETVTTGNATDRAPTTSSETVNAFGEFYVRGLKALIANAVAEYPVEAPTGAFFRAASVLKKQTGMSREFRALAMELVQASTNLLTSEKAVSALTKAYEGLGSYRDRESRRLVWKRNADIAASMLLERAKLDYDVDRLTEVAGLLAEIADADELVSQLTGPGLRTNEFVEALLRAVRWSERPMSAQVQTRLAAALSELSQSADPDVRASAYSTVSVLPRELALPLLQDAKGREQDDVALAAIEETEASFAD